VQIPTALFKVISLSVDCLLKIIIGSVALWGAASGKMLVDIKLVMVVWPVK
jgi:hypothetical protein